MTAILLILRLALLQAAEPCDQAVLQARQAEAMVATTGQARLAPARAAVAACPSSAIAHNTLGTALEETADFEGAARAYREAARLSPAWSLPQLGLGDLAKRRGDTAGARAAYEQARKLAATDEERTMADEALASLGGRAGAPPVGEPQSQGYGYKDATSLTRGLQLQQEAAPPEKTRGFGPATLVSSDYGASGSGLVANLSIEFVAGSAELLPQARQQLTALGEAIRAGLGSIRFSIEGHASSEGDAAVNMALSRDRAQAVKAFLVSQFKFDPARFEAQGFGSTRPIIERGVENRLRSRRVAVVRKYDAR